MDERKEAFRMYGGYGGYGGYPLSSTTKVVGVIALVLILVLGGSTTYLLFTRGSDDGGDTCAFEKNELQEAKSRIEELEGKLANVGSGGSGGSGFFTNKTGFFGIPVWVLIVVASVVAFGLFQAYFGQQASRAIRGAAGYVGTGLNNISPSALSKRFSRRSAAKSTVGLPVANVVNAGSAESIFAAPKQLQADAELDRLIAAAK